MELRARLPGRRSRTERVRRRAGLVAKAGKQAAKHPGAAGKVARSTARAVRRVDVPALAAAALKATDTRRSRRIGKRTAAGAVGIVGAGAAAAAIAKSRRQQNGTSEGVTGESPHVHTSPHEGHPAGTGQRSDRDIGGPTVPEGASGSATGGGTGTKDTPGFEPHQD